MLSVLRARSPTLTITPEGCLDNTRFGAIDEGLLHLKHLRTGAYTVLPTFVLQVFLLVRLQNCAYLGVQKAL